MLFCEMAGVLVCRYVGQMAGVDRDVCWLVKRLG